VIPGRVCHCHRPRSAGTTTVRDVIMMLLAAWLRRRPAPYHVTRTGSGSLAGPGPGHWLALAWRDSLRLVPGGCPKAHWQGLAQAPSQVECRGAAGGRSLARTRPGAPSQPVSLGTPWPRRGSAGESCESRGAQNRRIAPNREARNKLKFPNSLPVSRCGPGRLGVIPGRV
jgi:hypothetical protein